MVEMAGKRSTASQGSSRRTGNRIVRVSDMASIGGGGNGSFRFGRRHGRPSGPRPALPIRLARDHPIREQGFSSDFVAGFSSRAIGRPIRSGVWFRAMIRPSRLYLIVRGSARRLSASPGCSSASFPTSRTSADPFRTSKACVAYGETRNSSIRRRACEPRRQAAVGGIPLGFRQGWTIKDMSASLPCLQDPIALPDNGHPDGVESLPYVAIPDWNDA